MSSFWRGPRIRGPEEWQSVQSKGRARWLLLEGGLGFGVPLGLIILILGLIDRAWFSSRAFPGIGTWLAVGTVVLGAGLLLGVLVAEINWRRSERRFA